ncbi:MAG: glutamine--fructose-6-phosphate transaminase (isomerizing) [Candidatus Paceibacterota bacterium]
MCGIFGYVGSRTAAPILLEGLRTLEYRGYDSSGIYVPGYGVVKSIGPIDNLAKKITETIPGTSGIAHTRWATHGAPTEKNAHPHSDMSEKIWLVHNGIIENYRELKEGLQVKGYKFYSDTDTEVLTKLIGSFYSGNLTEALTLALKSVRGTYGLLVMSERDPKELVAARFGSPIVLGLGSDGNFVSSDPSALLTHTKDVVYLDDGEIITVGPDSYLVTNIHGHKQNKQAEKIAWSHEEVQKNGFDHFMQKEIFEAPEVIENTIRGRLLVDKGRAKLGGLETVSQRLSAINKLQIIGCGSAYYAGLVGKFMLEEYAQIPTMVDLGSEYRYKKTFPDKKTAVLSISQSGETADTRASISKAKEDGLLTLGVVNVVGSAIARETDAGVYNHAGPEIAVASTKAFLSQLTAMALLTLFLGRERGMTQAEGIEIAKGLENLPNILREVLADHEVVKQVAKKYAHYRDFMYLGRQGHVPIAYEGSLKLKEVTYIHAEAYAGGELKHGSIAMLDNKFPVFALALEDEVYKKMVSNIEEVKARQAPVIALATVGDLSIGDVADDVIYVPKVHPMLQPIVSTIPLQLFAYYIGVEKGLNVDRPRNLAKSVTVE